MKQQHNKKRETAQGKSVQKMDLVHSQFNLDCVLVKHIHFECIDSTNTWAKLHPEQWDVKGLTLITASEQRGGRGRFKRHWISPPHLNIYATFCFWLDLQRTDMGHIPQVLAISAAQILECQGFSPTIKWPNDLLLQGKKVGGILCETILENGQRGIVCGIGLNINMPMEMLTQIDRPATSLLVEKKQSFDVAILLNSLKECFLINLNHFLDKGFSPFFPLLKERSALKQGEKVCFHDNQTFIMAHFEYLHPDGSVELRLSNGMLKTFYAGEFIYNSP